MMAATMMAATIEAATRAAADLSVSLEVVISKEMAKNVIIEAVAAMYGPRPPETQIPAIWRASAQTIAASHIHLRSVRFAAIASVTGIDMTM